MQLRHTYRLLFELFYLFRAASTFVTQPRSLLSYVLDRWYRKRRIEGLDKTSSFRTHTEQAERGLQPHNAVRIVETADLRQEGLTSLRGKRNGFAS